MANSKKKTPEVAIEQPERKPASPCIMVIFGMAGDLTKRLLYPAICNLGSNNLLDENFRVVGVSVEKFNDTSFRKELKSHVKEFITDKEAHDFGLKLADSVSYISGDFGDDKTYQQLSKKLADLDKQGFGKSCLFYFAAPPRFMSTIAHGLGKANLLEEQKGEFFRRMVVEKPFGHDLDSAKQLNKDLLSLTTEEQIFRIDHFLGKETVQNILAFRFSNGLFEPIWNHLYIDHIQISVSETLGVEERAGYYEHAGALRDMVPNHILEVLSLIAMEPPHSFSSDPIQDEKEKAIRSIKIMTPQEVLENSVRGQYDKGEIAGKHVPNYRAEPGVNPESDVETYVAMRLFFNNWRWFNVPFYLRTGKRMKERSSEIHIQFKQGPSTGFGSELQTKPNFLTIHIQPDEGISLRLNTKIPGPSMDLSQVFMKFRYADYFGMKPSTGYETILYDCMNGDHLLFKRAEAVERSWAVVQPILDVWGALKPMCFPNYESGGWGPKEADELIEKDGRKWIP